MFYKTGKEWSFELIHNDIWKYHKCIATIRAYDEYKFYDTRNRIVARMWKDRLGGWYDTKTNEAGLGVKIIEDFVRKHPHFKQIFDEIPIREVKYNGINYYKWRDVIRVFIKHCVRVSYREFGDEVPKRIEGFYPY